MGLFDKLEANNLEDAKPLAARMRPRSLAEFAGQKHFLGDGKLLRRILEADRLSSVIFYGPPGCGKTSLAELIATQTKSVFARLNAASAGVKEVRALLEQARDRLAADGTRTLLLVDELHHFNRTQQDVLLPDVESGVVRLIGATTENPFFSLVSPLVSRSQVFEFQAVSADEVLAVLKRALTDRERGLGSLDVSATDEALSFLADVSDGDVRRALTALEIGAYSVAGGQIDLQVAQESIQKKAIQYDDDTHYDAASALIKSMRGSDPARIRAFWLAGSSSRHRKTSATQTRRRWSSPTRPLRRRCSSGCPSVESFSRRRRPMSRWPRNRTPLTSRSMKHSTTFVSVAFCPFRRT